VRAFLDFMRDAIAGMRERIEGRQPQAEVPRRRSRRAPRVLGQGRG
jgi:hypothetical protein